MEVIIDGVRYLPEKPITNKAFSFSERIIKERKLKGETLDDASLNMNISKSQLWNMEQGLTEPKLRMLKKVLFYYGIDFNDIDWCR